MRPFKMLALSLIALTTTLGAMAQTVDDIVNKHVEAMGGAAKLKSLNTVYFEGNLTVPGAELPLKLYQVNNKALRLEFEAGGSENIQVITKEQGWVLMPVQNITSPTDLPAEQLKLAQRQLSLDGELLDYKAKNKKVELLGKETTDGQETYKLKVTDAEGTSTILLVDAGTYYLVGSEMTMNVQGQSVVIKSSFSDYKKTPEGYIFPHTTEQSVGGQSSGATFTKIEVNKPIDEAIFKKPA
ncbi:hypothetical protein [uncultured Chitinophaga sp.]|uniref:hypothetical protein n=1 Tax=uncultured Chitinophaga sp. TaxID=339340 RepID=UPI0025ED3117|nr:hypothetical protein [uncultured Chitinophaga sp.]